MSDRFYFKGKAIANSVPTPSSVGTGDRTPMFFGDDLMSDRHSQPRSFPHSFGGESLLEYFRFH